MTKKIIMIIGTPKSASTVIADCVATIRKIETGVGLGGTKVLYKEKKDHVHWDIPRDINKHTHLLAGRVYKDHITPSERNIGIMRDLGIKYMILTRHPADVLVGQYCTMLKLIRNETSVNPVKQIHPTPISSIYKDKMTHNYTKSLYHLITDGYLYNLLLWINKWLSHRDKESSMIIKYEEYVKDPDAFYKDVCKFIGIDGISGVTKYKCERIAKNYILSSVYNLNNKNYPEGYTGEIRVWRHYFNSDNIDAYNKVVKKYIKDNTLRDIGVDSELLLKLYPTLIIKDEYIAKIEKYLGIRNE